VSAATVPAPNSRLIEMQTAQHQNVSARILRFQHMPTLNSGMG